MNGKFYEQSLIKNETNFFLEQSDLVSNKLSSSMLSLTSWDELFLKT